MINKIVQNIKTLFVHATNQAGNKTKLNKQNLAVLLVIMGCILFLFVYTQIFDTPDTQTDDMHTPKKQITVSVKPTRTSKGFNIERVPVIPSRKQLAKIKEQTNILNDIIYYPNCGEVGCNDASAKDLELLDTTEYPDAKKSGLERTVHILNHPVKHIVKAPSYTRYFQNNKFPEIYVDGQDLRKYFADYCYADIQAHDMHIQYKGIKSDRVFVSYICPGGYFTSDAVITEEVRFENAVNCTPDGQGGCARIEKNAKKQNQAKSNRQPMLSNETVNLIQNFLAETKRALTK